MMASSVLGVIWLVFWLYWFAMAFRSKRNASVSGRGIGGRLIIFLLFAGIIRTTTNSRFGSTQAVSDPFAIGAGFALVALGLGLCIWARLNIGRNWGMPMTEKIDTELVTSGPYRYIRHPIYSGLFLAAIGSCFIVEPYWLIIFAVAAAYFVYSAVIEERNLSQKLPKVYPAYRRRTKMFIPFVI